MKICYYSSEEIYKDFKLYPLKFIKGGKIEIKCLFINEKIQYYSKIIFTDSINLKNDLEKMYKLKHFRCFINQKLQLKSKKNN